ncbi:MAG: class I SAM-dependent methyltransferase [Erysipelotrichales bacterium]|nr:class I SAM-dependent methyltransferase [Erysipelotrichales bacterium]
MTDATDTDRLRALLDALKPYFGSTPAARKHFALAQEHGLHILPVHFYSPVPDTAGLSPQTWTAPSALPGVDMNEAGQLALMETVFAKYHEDFAAFPLKRTGNDLEFSFENDQVSGADPFILHALVRELKPRRIVEVGGGYTTLVSAKAVRQNGSGEIVTIEPYPRPFLARALDGVGRLERRPLQEIDLELFASLGEDDILFIDSTHVSRIGSDVNRLFLEILPRLAPGVWVHVHDIFLPYDYPETWTRDMQFFWTEQYLLQAFLIGNRMYRVRFAVGYMGRRHPEAMAGTFPGWALGLGGGSFWMRREDAA